MVVARFMVRGTFTKGRRPLIMRSPLRRLVDWLFPKPTTYHRCLALHIANAGPTSALRNG
jgi:hypothetical protein